MPCDRKLGRGSSVPSGKQEYGIRMRARQPLCVCRVSRIRAYRTCLIRSAWYANFCVMRFVFEVDDRMAQRIDDWRFSHRVDSRAEAIRQLVQAALDRTAEQDTIRHIEEQRA